MSASRNQIRPAFWSRGLASLGYVMVVSVARIVILHGSVDNTLVNVDQFVVPLSFAAAWKLNLNRAAIFLVAFATAVVITSIDVLEISQRIFHWDALPIIDYLRATNDFPWMTILTYFFMILLTLCLVVGAMTVIVADRPRVWPLFCALQVLMTLDVVLGVNRYVDIAHKYNIAVSPGYTAAVTMAGQFSAGPTSLVPIRSETLSSSVDANDAPARMLSVAYESWGLANTASLREAIVQPLVSHLPDYKISRTGSHAFQGATLAGEIRELCGLQIVGVLKADAMSDRFGSCLPARLARAGYVTDALHGNGGRIYSRETVYPAIGFEKRYFHRELKSLGASRIPCTQNVFFGFCDRAVFDQALSLFDGRRRFVHVMTLDTHLPILPPPDSATTAYTGDRLLDAYLDAFRLSMRQLGNAIERAPVKPDRIILYGDHTPPFFSWRERARFVPGRVPYLVLDRLK